MEGSATEVEIERFQLKRGQVIITKDSEGWDDIGIPAVVTEDMPEVLCGYHLSVFEPGPELDGGFLAWLCRAEPLNDQFKLAANGVTRYGLGQYPMKNAFIALPPLDTQRRIARFLDEKTVRIDGLIEKKRALLDRLAEKRQALITRAVTKGLNPRAPTKHSGIDWLGDIPAHWEVLPLRRVTLRVATGRTPPSTNTDYFSDGLLNWFTPGDFSTSIELDESAPQGDSRSHRGRCLHSLSCRDRIPRWYRCHPRESRREHDGGISKPANQFHPARQGTTIHTLWRISFMASEQRCVSHPMATHSEYSTRMGQSLS